MYDPVVPHILRAYRQATRTRRAPFLPSYHLAYAQKKTYIRHPQFDVVWQAHDAQDAYVSFLEIQTQEALRIPLTCKRADVHWIYVLKGNAAFPTPRLADTFVPFQLQPSEYTVCYTAPAEYELQVAAGTTLVIHCCVKASWLLRDAADYSSPFQPLLRALARESSCCLHMAVLPIAPAVQTELLALAIVPAANGPVVDTQVYGHVTELIRLSQEAVPHLDRRDQTELLQTVRRYLREQVAEGKAPRIQELAHTFGMTQQHLNRLHRQQYGHSLKPYLTHIRMTAALQLLRKGHSATEVAYRLGYADKNNFRRQFQAYYGFPTTALPK